MLEFAVAVAALLAILVALLAVPVEVVIDAERADTLEARWRMRWLFGLVDIRSARARAARSGRRPEEPRTPAEPRTAAVRRRRRTRMGIAVLRTRGLLRRVVRLAWRLCRQIRFQGFHAHAAFGLDDPADTGVVYGVLSPLLVMARTRGLDIDCRPMFLESGVRGTLSGTFHVRPLPVVGSLVAFLVSPPVLRAVRAAWRARR